MNTLYVADGPGELRLAVIDGEGLLVAAEVHRPGSPDRVGELHLGRIGARIPGGWFVRLHDGDGFLPANEVPRARGTVNEGEGVVVLVTRAAFAGKGLRLSMKVPAAPAITGSGEPRRIRAAPDAVARMREDYAATDVHTAEFFPDDVEEAFSELLESRVGLPDGGTVSIHPTDAATLLDVDAAGQEAVQANRRAAPAIARLIVARNLSGVILIDFAGLEGAAAKRRMAEVMAKALAGDPLRAEVTGYSPAGLIEVVRRKLRPPLHEVLWQPGMRFRPSDPTYALQAVRRAMAEALANPAARPAIRAHPHVSAAIEASPAALARYSARTGLALS